MTTFDLRERAYETRYAREQEAQFIVNAKACSLFAKWVAEEKLGLSKAASDRYCGKILAITIKDCNPQTLYKFIQKKLLKHDIVISDRELEYQYIKALNIVRSTNQPS